MAKVDRKLQFGMLGLLLISFTALSTGLVVSQSDMVVAVSALSDKNPKAESYVSVMDNAFDSKVLRFVKKEKVCTLTQQQRETLEANYDVQLKEFDTDGGTVKVLYVSGNPLNKNIIERLTGESFEGKCNVVHGNKVIALISPVLVS